MGGLFRAPKPPAPPHAAPSVPGPAPNLAPAAAPAGGEEDARKRRAFALESRRRGRSDTVATSWRGVLTDSLPAVGRKSLLGE